MQKPRDRARSTFWRTVTSDWRAWILLALCGLGGLAGGIIFSWGHGEKGAVFWTVVWAAIGLLVALVLILLSLWVSSPFALIREELASLDQRIDRIEASTGAPATLRIGLLAMQGELRSAAAVIEEAKERGAWWRSHDALPAQQHSDHFAALADPALPANARDTVRLAYQCCNRMNHRIEGRRVAHREANPMAVFTKTPAFELSDADIVKLDETLETIRAADETIASQVDAKKEPS
jgi:hypothetical protein